MAVITVVEWFMVLRINAVDFTYKHKDNDLHYMYIIEKMNIWSVIEKKQVFLKDTL